MELASNPSAAAVLEWGVIERKVDILRRSGVARILVWEGAHCYDLDLV